ncbi:hypothetical protein [Saccharophagus degradans]|uniref:TLDc domain-containing protein n=1 Tax=Saccharophagus degradans TaxID=86304 RepID=A0AAW7X028_9GAMM|nr:hypothetical protein [Saccharophagus degradans]MDO6420854.1 hypothetical protein [Saccharophagus degradans]MDO6609703.1 hypothetical protein [Saccharophagus degradans]
MINGPENYFPEEASYLSFPNVCSKNMCFHLVAMEYVSESNKGMKRLAVFSSDGKYIGVYSGFNELPLKSDGSSLVFPASEYGYLIDFSGGQPPSTVYIDGENFDFEKRP